MGLNNAISRKDTKRPKSIYFIGSFFGLYSLFGIYVLTYTLVKEKFTMDFLSILFLSIVYLYDIFIIIFAIGLLKFRSWGRICIVFVCVIDSILFISNQFMAKMLPNDGQVHKTPLLLLIYIFVLWYLTRPKIKEVFAKLGKIEPPFLRWE